MVSSVTHIPISSRSMMQPQHPEGNCELSTVNCELGPQALLKMSVTLWPPKPKELLMAWLMPPVSLASLGT